jgi:threonine dehydratase
MTTHMKGPTLADIFAASRVLSRHLHRTPLHHHPALSDLLGCHAYVKHENHQPLGAFKVRGGINLISRLSDEEREAGVICASTGNHGQSIAFASRLFGVAAHIVVPGKSNPDKVAAMKRLGAELISHGKDFDEARERSEELSRQYGYRYVHSGNEPHLIAGVGTIGLEIMEDLPDVDTVIVPVGGGSQSAGVSIAVHGVRPEVEVIGVQSEQAPAAWQSWKEGRPVALDKMETFAEGLATRVGFELPQAIMKEHFSDFILVPDEEISRAVAIVLETTHNLAEPAGAASVAAALRLRDRLAGKKVVLSLSGGNITLEQLRAILHNGS